MKTGPEGPQSFYLLLILLTITKIGSVAHTRMFQGLAEE
jgi:hypothetical protein